MRRQTHEIHSQSPPITTNNPPITSNSMSNHLPITSSCPLIHARVSGDLRERQRARAEQSIASLQSPSLFAWLEHTPDLRASPGPVLVLHMGKHMDAKTTALCYFYRHPPWQSGVKLIIELMHTSDSRGGMLTKKHMRVTFVIRRLFRVQANVENESVAFLFSGAGALSSVRK